MKQQLRLASAHRYILFIWVFVLVLSLFPLTANPVKPIKELASSIAVFLLAVSMLAWPIRRGEPYDWPRMPVLLLSGLWLLWGLVCALFSDFKMAGFDELRVYLTWLLIALFAARVFRDPGHVRQLFLVICIAVFLSSVYGFIQYFGLDPFPWSTRDVEEYRGLPSTYANPNFAGHTLMLTLILGGCLAMTKRLRWVLLFLVPIALHLYLTHMRGAPLALAAGCVFLLCAWLVSRLPQIGVELRPVASLAAVAVIGIAGVAALMPVSKMLTGFYVPTDGSLILRYNGYYGAAKMTADHPVLGVGPGNFGRMAIAYWTPYEKRWFADQQKRNMRAHCDLLETATESGLPGLALHVALLMALLVRSLTLAFTGADPERRRLGYTLAVFFMAFLVDGLFGFNLRVPVSGAFFFLMAGVLEGVLSPTALPVPQAVPERKKKKKNELPVPVPEIQTQPRVFSSMALCAAALVCLVFAGVVIVAEMYYQRGNGMRLTAESTENTMQQGQALKLGEDALLAGRRLMFWDERYSDMLGHLAMRGGQTEAAITYYTRALATDPYHPHKAANLARAYLSHALRYARDNAAPDYAQVGALLDEAARYGVQAETYCHISPYVQDVTWRVVRAQAILAEEQDRDARPYWEDMSRRIEEALRYGATDVPGTYKALGTARVKLEQPEQAFTPLTRVLESDMNDQIAWDLFEEAATESGKGGALLDMLYRQYVLLAPRAAEQEEAFAAAVRRMAHVTRDVEKAPGAAFRLARRGLAVAPKSPELWALFAGLAAKQGRKDLFCGQGEEFIRGGVKAADMPAFVQGICSEQGTGMPLAESSRDIARLAMQHAGQDATRDFGGAADLIAQVLAGLQLEPQRTAEVQANMATAYLEAERWEDADKGFSMAIDILPQNARGRLLSARCRALSGMGRNEEAMKFIQEAVQLAPADPLVQLTYARLLREAGRLDEAAFAFTAAINTLPEKSPLKAQAQRELELMRAKGKRPPETTES